LTLHVSPHGRALVVLLCSALLRQPESLINTAGKITLILRGSFISAFSH
jgi:hypothetical protein